MKAVAALPLLPAVLLSGCSRREQAPPMSSATKLRVAFRPALSHAPLLIADQEGYFRRQGLEIEFVVSDSRTGLPGLMEGRLDVMAGYVAAGYFNAIARGAHLRIVADKGHLDREGCTYAALVAREQLLRGARLQGPEPPTEWRIAVRRGSVEEFLVDLALRAERIPPDRVEFKRLPAEAEAEALRRGLIDLTMAAGSSVEHAIRAGSGVVWHTAQALAPDFPFLVVVYGPTLLTKDPEAGRRFMVAYLQGVRQHNEGKTERNLEILQNRLGFDRETLLQSCWVPVRDDGRIHVQGLLEFQAWAQRKGLLDRPLAAEEFWEPRFVELAAEELDLPTRAAAGP